MIVINSKWAVELDAAQLNYSPLVWQEAKETKNPKTGEIKTKPAQWTHLGLYFPNIHLALKEILAQEFKQVGVVDQDIKQYMDEMVKLSKEFQKDCLDKLERQPEI